MPIEAPEELQAEELGVQPQAIASPMGSSVRPPQLGTLGGQRLIGYPGIDQATIAQYQAQGAESDREFIEVMLTHSRLADAQKAIEAAIRFQAMRQFDRDLEVGKAAGLSPQQATLQSLSRHGGRMFFTSPVAAERALMSSAGPRVYRGPGIQPFAVGPSGTPTRLAVPPQAFKLHTTPGGQEVGTYGTQMRVLSPPAGKGLTAAQQYGILQKRAQRLTDDARAQDPGTPAAKAAEAARDEAVGALEEFERLYVGTSGGPSRGVPAIAAPKEPGPSRPRRTAQTRVRRKADGKTFIYRGDPADIPTDRFEVVR